MTMFSAGSEWTRGARYDSADPALDFTFLEDEGVGPPLWDSPDNTKTYQIHGRARFDTWDALPEIVDPSSPAAAASSISAADDLSDPSATPPNESCGSLVAVMIGCTSYGNGAKPTDMGWDIKRRGGGHALVSAQGDAFAWGANVVRVACLPPGAYEFTARDEGGLARGWGPGATLSVLQLEQTPGGQFFHGHRLSQEAEIADWFDRGHEATFAFDVGKTVSGRV